MTELPEQIQKPVRPNQLAMWCMIIGLLNVFFCCLNPAGAIIGIPVVIMSITALKTIKQTGAPGKAMAIIGLIAGIISTLFTILELVLIIFGISVSTIAFGGLAAALISFFESTESYWLVDIIRQIAESLGIY